METGNKLRLADVFVSISDPGQAGKIEHNLVELLVVAVNAVLVGADTFVEIELWAKEKLEWLRGYLRLEAGIPSHDTFGRLFGLIDPDEFEAAFRRWVATVLPALFKAAPEKTPHGLAETVEKDHGRLETRRCFAFDQLPCLHKPEQWPDLKSFAVVESERLIHGKTSFRTTFPYQQPAR